MKQNFKLIPIMLSIVMVLSLTACGNKDIRGSVDSNNNAENSEAPIAEEVTYESGSTTGGVYTNEFIGIGCELDENWTYYNDAELSELNGLVSDALSDEELAEMLENSKTVYDMFALADEGLTTINVVIENIGVINGATMDENDYIEKSLELTKSGLESMGFTNVSAEKATMEFAGVERAGIAIVGEYSGAPVYEKMVCIKIGNYMADITVCSFNEDITAKLMSFFYTLG